MCDSISKNSAIKKKKDNVVQDFAHANIASSILVALSLIVITVTL